MAGSDLADWITSIGLEVYADVISQLVGTGERLASISSSCEDLQVSTLLLIALSVSSLPPSSVLVW